MIFLHEILEDNESQETRAFVRMFGVLDSFTVLI